MNTATIIVGIIGIVFGGGVASAVVALIKVRPEAGQILVTTAQGAVIVQTGVIESLRQEIARLGEEMSELREQNDRLRARVRDLEGKSD